MRAIRLAARQQTFAPNRRPSAPMASVVAGDPGIAAAYDAMESAPFDEAGQQRGVATLTRPTDGSRPVPIPFAEPAGSVRLLAAPVALPAGAQALVASLLAELLSPLDAASVYITPVDRYHATLFHTGRPGDPRPADAADVEAELALLRPLLAATPAWTLTVDRVVLTDTGVVTLLYQTGDGAPLRLRERLRAAVPGAPAQQTRILHSSLARLRDAPGVAGLARLRGACAAASQALHGAEVRCERVWHVVERSLPCDGDVTVCPLGES